MDRPFKISKILQIKVTLLCSPSQWAKNRYQKDNLFFICKCSVNSEWQHFPLLFTIKRSKWQIQEVTAFRDFRIRDPRYFVIWFHALFRENFRDFEKKNPKKKFFPGFFLEIFFIVLCVMAVFLPLLAFCSLSINLNCTVGHDNYKFVASICF